MTATPNSGYTFVNWKIDGNDDGSTNPYSLLMDGNHTIQAVFTSGSQTINATAPLQLQGNTISIPQANASTNGYLGFFRLEQLQ